MVAEPGLKDLFGTIAMTDTIGAMRQAHIEAQLESHCKRTDRQAFEFGKSLKIDASSLQVAQKKDDVRVKNLEEAQEAQSPNFSATGAKFEDMATKPGSIMAANQ